MEALYIHIPFCKHICSYCDFPKILYDETVASQYLDSLKNEIEEYYNNENISTIYIGGGTPSALSLNNLNKLFNILKKINKSNLKEFTFECNVNDITEELLVLLKENQVNRISLGVESFEQENLRIMERNTTYEEVLNKITLLREKGFDNINIDLMYGLPNETLSVLKKDLSLILKLNPTHISTYSLILEEHTKLNNLQVSEIDEETEVKMYEYINKKLKKAHFEHYEISNFAIPGYESKHNLTYWNNEEYYGFGLGAHGYIEGFRYSNTRNLNEYLNNHYRNSEKLISKQEQMENEVMLGLRKIKGINLQEFYDKYEINLQEAFPIKPLIKNKDLIYENGYVYINPEKIYVMNEILLKLI